MEHNKGTQNEMELINEKELLKMKWNTTKELIQNEMELINEKELLKMKWK